MAPAVRDVRGRRAHVRSVPERVPPALRRLGLLRVPPLLGAGVPGAGVLGAAVPSRAARREQRAGPQHRAQGERAARSRGLLHADGELQGGDAGEDKARHAGGGQEAAARARQPERHPHRLAGERPGRQARAAQRQLPREGRAGQILGQRLVLPPGLARRGPRPLRRHGRPQVRGGFQPGGAVRALQVRGLLHRDLVGQGAAPSQLRRGDVHLDLHARGRAPPAGRLEPRSADPFPVPQR
mmetsp:Transcript_57092/g.177187  ORF Transcript_57092/g.177187 Transcript_57092/m.177187 type:complete len:240 (-) Transcript_57092:146-865(-)